DWNTMPMPRSFGSSQVTFLPLMKIFPPEMSSRPAMQLSSVDLPQPDGPSRTTNSPSRISRSSDFRTWIVPKFSERSWIETLEDAAAMLSVVNVILTPSSSPLDRTGGGAADEPAAGNEKDSGRAPPTLRIVAAMLTLYSRTPVVVLTMLLSCTVIGQLDRPAKTTPNRKSFQMPVTWRMTATIVTGTDMGSIMWKKTRQKPAPSTRAALNSSTGSAG
ncbi:hypothetical protein COL154_014055, partial [Colletotrichum chrysophilum]